MGLLEPFTFAVDMMGTDYGPDEILAGVLQFAKEHRRVAVLCVGLPKCCPLTLPPNVHWVASGSVVEMGEVPGAVRHKRDSSIMVAAKLVRQGEANALVGFGSSGAAVLASDLFLGGKGGLPCLAGVFPSRSELGFGVVSDIGALTSPTPERLAAIAKQTVTFAQRYFHSDGPVSLGLLSNGSESHKGTATIREACELLGRADITGLRFHGQIEPRDLFNGDVVAGVCDGMIGNIYLKAAESAVQAYNDELKAALCSSLYGKMLGLLLRRYGPVRDLRRRFDCDETAGAVLLGQRNLVIVGHGNSDHRAACSALEFTLKCARNPALLYPKSL